MQTLFTVLFILIISLSLISGILLFAAERRKQKRTLAAFANISAVPTVKIGDLWIDPETQKWAIAKEAPDLSVYSYSDIDKAELIQDGETYVQKEGVLQSQLGGLVFGMIQSATQSKKKTRMSGNIYIHIYVCGAPFPLETMVLLGTPMKTESNAFRKKVLFAEKLMHTLNAMKDGTYQPESESAEK